MSFEKPTILIVDDTPENIDVLVGILKDDYQIKVAIDGKTALHIVYQTPPDLILLDIMMPEMDGTEVCRQLKLDPLTSQIPVIFVTAMGETEDEATGLNLGAVDYIVKPVNSAIVKARVKTHLALSQQAQHLEGLVKERTEEVEETRQQVIQCLGRAAEYKDNQTGMHVIRMSHYSHRLAIAYNMPEHFCNMLLHAAPMHDIGKIGIPDHILKKPSRLDEEEWRVMRTHPELGTKILNAMPSELMHMAANIAASHHERWDGKGYPHGLSGEQIPICGRIVAITDVFDALTSERPYKKAWSVEDTLDYIKEERGRHFDPDLVDCFLTIVPQLLEIKARYQEIES